MRNAAHVSESELVTTAEAAAILNVSVSTVNRMADAGRLGAAHKFPGLRGPRLYKRRAVEAVLSQRTPAA